MKPHKTQLQDLLENESGALFSPDRAHRFLLWRKWGDSKKLLLFVGLNPSMANEKDNDPTIRRIISFAKREQAAGVMVANLFSFCATEPKVLKAQTSPVHEANDQWLLAAHQLASQTIICWGVHGSHQNRSGEIRTLLKDAVSFGLTKHGEPRHPLYLRKDTPLRSQ